MKWIDAAALRFLVVGGFNTLLGYGLYLLLNRVFDYRIAYTLSFVIGIVVSFVLNSVFAFRQPLRWRRLLVYPAVYLLQYIAGLGVVWVFVAVFGQSETWAPLVAVVFTLPLTFLATRYVLSAKTDAAAHHR
jgi:putative flippase GtrA